MDVKIDHEYDGDGVRCVFSMSDSISAKTTARVFENEQSALNLATFIAAQRGVVSATELHDWLAARGFHVEDFEAADREAAAATLRAAGQITVRGPPLPAHANEEPQPKSETDGV
jgi:hypothetical protein